MELFPELKLGWLNGWLPLTVFYVVFGFLLITFPKDVVKRLYARPRWSRTQLVVTTIGKLITFANLVLVIFTPLKVGTAVFAVGSLVFAAGFAGMVIALFNYRDAPPDQPATKGLYRISRNPQAVMMAALLMGVCIAVGSWFAVLVMVAAFTTYHFRILGEEQACLEQYGDSYRSYMQRIPRYFVVRRRFAPSAAKAKPLAAGLDGIGKDK